MEVEVEVESKVSLDLTPNVAKLSREGLNENNSERPVDATAEKHNSLTD